MLPVLEGMEGSSLFREPLAAAGGPRRPRVGARPGVSLWGGGANEGPKGECTHTGSVKAAERWHGLRSQVGL